MKTEAVTVLKTDYNPGSTSENVMTGTPRFLLFFRKLGDRKSAQFHCEEMGEHISEGNSHSDGRGRASYHMTIDYEEYDVGIGSQHHFWGTIVRPNFFARLLSLRVGFFFKSCS